MWGMLAIWKVFEVGKMVEELVVRLGMFELMGLLQTEVMESSHQKLVVAALLDYCLKG